MTTKASNNNNSNSNNNNNNFHTISCVPDVCGFL